MNTKLITRTAMLIALLVAVQYVTKSAGQIVTGSCVNLILALLSGKLNVKAANVLSVLLAAVCKFLLLWGLIVGLLLPSMGLPSEKVAALSATFSYPQLITALIGGGLSLLVVPSLKKAVKQQ